MGISALLVKKQLISSAFAGLMLLAAGAAYAAQGLKLASLTETQGPATPRIATGSTINPTGASSVAHDRQGNLYATTASGGRYNKGAVYRLAPDGSETILHSFSGGPDDGAAPLGIVVDGTGNLYGLTTAGGSGRCARAEGCGTIFRIAPDGRETIYAFKGGADGATPVGMPVVGKAGHLYGTTKAGGRAGCGTVFEFSSSAGEKVLHAFTPAEGTPSLGVLNADAKGDLYGATSGQHVSLFRLTLNGTLTILFHFA